MSGCQNCYNTYGGETVQCWNCIKQIELESNIEEIMNSISACHNKLNTLDTELKEMINEQSEKIKVSRELMEATTNDMVICHDKINALDKNNVDKLSQQIIQLSQQYDSIKDEINKLSQQVEKNNSSPLEKLDTKNSLSTYYLSVALKLVESRTSASTHIYNKNSLRFNFNDSLEMSERHPDNSVVRHMIDFVKSNEHNILTITIHETHVLIVFNQ